MRAREERLDVSLELDFSLLDEVAPVDNRKDFAGVMVGDEDADLFLLEDGDEVFDIGDRQRINIGKGLIEKKEGGLSHEGPRNF